MSGKLIDVTPTWSGMLPSLLVLLRDSPAVSQRFARSQLALMAELADRHVAEHGGLIVAGKQARFRGETNWFCVSDDHNNPESFEYRTIYATGEK